MSRHAFAHVSLSFASAPSLAGCVYRPTEPLSAQTSSADAHLFCRGG